MTALPAWIDAELWAEYVTQRRKDKKAMSPRSERDRLARLYELHAAGHDPNTSLADALNGHWLDFYEPQDKSIAKVKCVESTVDYAARVATESALDRARVSPPPAAVKALVAQLNGGLK